jgi:selenide,water dikinase
LLPGVRELLHQGHKTGASGRNWAGYGRLVNLGRYGEMEQALLTDPQTSGGLLVACAPGAVEQVLAIFRADGFEHAAVIGERLRQVNPA